MNLVFLVVFIFLMLLIKAYFDHLENREYDNIAIEMAKAENHFNSIPRAHRDENYSLSHRGYEHRYEHGHIIT